MEKLFLLPQVTNWITYNSEEKSRKRELARQNQSLPIEQKQTISSRMHASVDPSSPANEAMKSLLKDDGSSRANRAADVSLPDYVRGHRETIKDFIAKKRQIFLAQMSLDTKRTEISKLDQRARQRAEALQASEDALEEDAKHFDDYLKENDNKLQEALRRADCEAKARQEKVSEAKKLSGSILLVKAEMQRAQEQLQECERYKKFVERVTPDEWFADVMASREARKKALRDAWQSECDDISCKKQEALVGKQKAEHDMQWARTQQQFEKAEKAYRESVVFLREMMALKDPPIPDYSAVDREEEGMYFTNPAEMLEVFSQLEGRNIFMIQTVQDAEQKLEAARAAKAQACETLGTEVRILQQQLQSLEVEIAAAERKCHQLQAATAKNFAGGDSIGSQSVSFGRFVETLTRVYEMCGYDSDASVAPLQMLSKIEARLEDTLCKIEANLPPGFAEHTEKSREKSRREAARQQKLAAQKAEHEARLQRVLERAAAPPFKKMGKPMMHRSQLKHTERQEASLMQLRSHNEEEELKAYLEMCT